MMAEPGCCQGCVPANRLAVVEILADHPLKLGTGQVRVAGNWQVSSDPTAGATSCRAPR
jgi:membrane dipeptidase